MARTAEEAAREKAIETIFDMPYNRTHLPNTDYVDFLKKLNRCHFELKAGLKAGVKELAVEKEAAFKSLRDGIPLLARHDLYLPDNVLLDGAREIVSTVLEAGMAGKFELECFLDALGEGEPTAAELVRRVLCRDEDYFAELGEKFGLPPAVIGMIVCRLASPLLELYAAPLRALFEDRPWRKGYCPVCGARAGLSVYTAGGRFGLPDGARKLVCRVCRTDWPFPRLSCAHCGRPQDDSMSYVYTDDVENPYRVDVCNSCKRAVKAIDLRKWNGPEVGENVAEHMAVYYLDLLAEKKGYRT